MDQIDPNRPIHNIGVVERRTGIKADLVRAWERRYQAVVPKRTATDRRLYSEADVHRLTLLHKATRLGHRISHIAPLRGDQLEQLLEPATTTSEPSETGDLRTDLEPRIALCLAAIQTLDTEALRRELARASFTLSRVALVEQLLVPLMEQVGLGWLRGSISPAQEHMATAAIRSFVGEFLSIPAPAESPLIVVTTPAGQLHELGALLAAAMATAEGWRVLYLGPNLPMEEIFQAARQSGADVIAVSVTYPEASPHLTKDMTRLLEALEGHQLIAGGRGSSSLQPLAQQANFTIVKDMADLHQTLLRLRALKEEDGFE